MPGFSASILLCAAASAGTSFAADHIDSITQKSFGSTSKGAPVTLYTLTNKKGMSVSLMDYGATVVNLLVPIESEIWTTLCLASTAWSLTRRPPPISARRSGAMEIALPRENSNLTAPPTICP